MEIEQDIFKNQKLIDQDLHNFIFFKVEIFENYFF